VLSWLTPNLSVLGAPGDCRTISLPGELWQYVTGALLPLSAPWNWEQYGDATPQEVADYFADIINNHLDSMCNYIGELRPFSFSPLPDKWLELDGSSVDAGIYSQLAAIVPSSWVSGGNINLPDMRSRSIVGNGSGYDLGDLGGEESHTLDIGEIPAHTHSYELAVLGTDILGELPAPSLNSLVPASTGSIGGGGAHNNMPPYLIAVWGIFAGV